jgi:hypothetical protein
MKKLLLPICVAIAIICFAACGTSQSTAAQLSTPTTNTSTQSDLFKAGEQLGAALKFFSGQKATNGKINYEDPTTYLQMAVIVQNAKIIKANYKDKSQYNVLVEGLKAKSGELINEQNADAVIDTLVNKIANSETGKKVQDNATNAKGWIDEHQDTIDAMNLLLDTLKN